MKLADELGLEMQSPPRKQKLPTRIHSNTADAYYVETAKQDFGITYKEIADTVIMEVQKRFRENDLAVLSAMESLLVTSFIHPKPDEESFKVVREFYMTDFDFGRLHHQLSAFYSDAKKAGVEDCEKDDSYKALTGCYAMNKLRKLFAQSSYRKAYPDVFKLIKTFLVIPVSSTESERSFSHLPRVKTWLRSTMGQERLTALALLTIEREEAESLKTTLTTLLYSFANEVTRDFY